MMVKKIKNYIAATYDQAKLSASSAMTKGAEFAAMRGRRGNAGMDYILNATLVVLVLGALGVTIFSSLNGLKNDGNLSTAEKALIGIVGVFFIIGVVKYFYSGSGAKR